MLKLCVTTTVNVKEVLYVTRRGTLFGTYGQGKSSPNRYTKQVSHFALVFIVHGENSS